MSQHQGPPNHPGYPPYPGYQANSNYGGAPTQGAPTQGYPAQPQPGAGYPAPQGAPPYPGTPQYPQHGYPTAQQPGYGQQGYPPNPYGAPQMVVVQNYVPMTRPDAKKKETAVLLSALGFVGISGLQRMYLGEVGLGVLYLFTGGLCGIGQIIDLIKFAQMSQAEFDQRYGMPQGAHPAALGAPQHGPAGSNNPHRPGGPYG